VAAPDAPLPSTAAPPIPGDEEEEEDDGEEGTDEDDETGPPTPAPPARPPAPTFKFSTFIIVFLGFLGLYMLIDPAARNQIATLLGVSDVHNGPLFLAIGFHSSYLFLTMALAGALEMLITALAYNYTTDWVKAAKVQKWSAAFRKVQMAALRSGKKDRMEALKPHQERLARLSAEVSIAQFKGMAITYFLLILIYSWVGLVIANASVAQQTIGLGGASIDLMHVVVRIGSDGIPFWFVIFSLYTVPFSLVFRRLLKQFWLRRYAEEHRLSAPPASGAVGGTA